MTLAWQVQKGVQRTALLRLNADPMEIKIY